MKEFIENGLKKIFNRYYILLENDKNSLIFKIKKFNIPLPMYIEIKHRNTGKTIKLRVKNFKAKLNLEQMVEMGEYKSFDAYLKIYIFKKKHRIRIPYTPQNQKAIIYSQNNKVILESYRTIKGNLSFKFEKSNLFSEITSLNYLNKNLYLKGLVDIPSSKNDLESDINSLKVVLKRKNSYIKKSFIVNYTPVDNNKISFEGIIPIKNLENNIHTRWEFHIKLNYNNKLYESLISAKKYENYSEDEKRYLLTIENENSVESIYVNKKNYFLELWVTSKRLYEKSYNKSLGKTVYNKTCESKPLNNKMIFFESFFGKSYSGNPKYIYEKMLKEGYGKEYTFVWSYSGNNEIPGNPIIVNRDQKEFYVYLASSKYWINNFMFPLNEKREGNIYLQTWHGIPFKKIGYNIRIKGPEKEDRRNLYLESKNWDYLISPSHYSSEIFKNAFKYEKKILEVGSPVNDIFFYKDEEFILNLKKKLNIDKDKKIILYAPTWRENEIKESWSYYLNLKIDLKLLHEKFNDEYIILVKTHHLIDEPLKIDDEFKEFVFDLSNYEDVQELCLISDILITDYSSICFDFANTKRPILFFAPDLVEYRDEVRGLYLNMFTDLPGPVIESNSELVKSIMGINNIEKIYKEIYDEFYKEYCSLANGSSSKKAIDMIFKDKK